MPVRSSIRPPCRARLSRPALRIGLVALTDSAPYLVARELGLYERHGLDVTLSCEAGWGTIRERLLNREVDAAHAVSGLVLAMRLGLGSSPCRVVTGLVTSLQGNAITLSHDLWQRGVRDAGGLLKLIRSTPQRLFTFGVASRVS
jgi:ABC-type nitrate/sulfonate/bicarbonate transport system substrate-binding protein